MHTLTSTHMQAYLHQEKEEEEEERITVGNVMCPWHPQKDRFLKTSASDGIYSVFKERREGGRKPRNATDRIMGACSGGFGWF